MSLIAFDDYVSPPGDKRDGFLGPKKPLVKEVRFLAIPDAATVKAGLQSGAIDVSSVPESEVAELQADPNLTVELGTNPVRHSIILQTRDPVLKNVKMRQAMAAAIDYQALVDAVTEGIGKVNNSPVYRTSQYYGPVEQQGFTYDPERGQDAARGGRLQGREDRPDRQQAVDRAELQHRGDRPADVAGGRAERRDRGAGLGRPAR